MSSLEGLVVRAGAEHGLAGREDRALDQTRAMDRFLADVERRAFRIAQLGVRDADAALDIVQDTMMRLVRRYGHRPSDEWRPLFFRILQNRIRDHQRRETLRRRWFPFGDRDPGDGEDPVERAPAATASQPDRAVDRASAMQTLEAAVAELPDRQRQAFLLRALEQLDVASTAAAMGCSEGSVKTHYSRAVHRLREALGDHWE